MTPSSIVTKHIISSRTTGNLYVPCSRSVFEDYRLTYQSLQCYLGFALVLFSVSLIVHFLAPDWTVIFCQVFLIFSSLHERQKDCETSITTLTARAYCCLHVAYNLCVSISSR